MQIVPNLKKAALACLLPRKNYGMLFNMIIISPL